jgi:hypothetical protein
VGFGSLGNVIYNPQGGGGGGGSWQGTPGNIVVSPLPPFHTTVYNEQQRVCDGSYYPQACHHYSSVASRNPVHSTIRCDVNRWNIFDETGYGRQRYPRKWNSQHNAAWSITWLPKSYIPATGGPSTDVNCQRDEWPPFECVPILIIIFVFTWV